MKIIALLVFNLISFNVSAFSLSDYEKNIKNNYSLKNVVDKVFRDDLQKEIRDFISSSRPSRVVGSQGHVKAQEYLENTLSKLKNGNLIIQNFSNGNFSNKNFIWERSGSSVGKKIILLTHFDSKYLPSISNTTEYQGADSSATGVAALVMLSRVLNELDLKKSVSVVFLDSVEKDKKGIWTFLDQYSKKEENKDAIYINVNSVGHDSKNKDKLKTLNNMGFYLLDFNSNNSNKEIYSKFIQFGKDHYPQIKFDPNQTFKSLYLDLDDVFRSNSLNLLVLTHDRENDLNQRLGSTNDFLETLNIDTLVFVYKFITSNVLAFNYDIFK